MHSMQNNLISPVECPILYGIFRYCAEVMVRYLLIILPSKISFKCSRRCQFHQGFTFYCKFPQFTLLLAKYFTKMLENELKIWNLLIFIFLTMPISFFRPISPLLPISMHTVAYTNVQSIWTSVK